MPWIIMNSWRFSLKTKLSRGTIEQENPVSGCKAWIPAKMVWKNDMIMYERCTYDMENSHSNNENHLGIRWISDESDPAGCFQWLQLSWSHFYVWKWDMSETAGHASWASVQFLDKPIHEKLALNGTQHVAMVTCQWLMGNRNNN